MEKVYLGDGLYAQHDGFMFTLITERRDALHFVALEPEVLTAFFRYVEKVCEVKITVTKKGDGDDRPRDVDDGVRSAEGDQTSAGGFTPPTGETSIPY